jgi:hypothetical protein
VTLATPAARRGLRLQNRPRRADRALPENRHAETYRRDTGMICFIWDAPAITEAGRRSEGA